ncbi:MAG: quinolinate synthase [Proteobacteria bacterium]|nr:quinolinate synthase [Pseudomonadota bacterium]
MNDTARAFCDFPELSDDSASEKVRVLKEKLGKKIVILSHHYQRADVYRHADLVGDSFKLAKLAANSEAEYLIFCGVHFMAEVADILSKQTQRVILPDLAAGCSMADMANLAKVERTWAELSEIMNPDQWITPVTYINSAADLKGFCGRHGGIVCTSSNAAKILDWAFGQREKVLFFPDQHLGRWTGFQKGLLKHQMVVWDQDLPMGGLSETEIDNAKILLWKGHCSVHQMFQAQHITNFREKFPEGYVISHPECRLEVCEMSDFVGSTEFIVSKISAAPSGTRWLVGTELNLVNRLADEFKPLGKLVHFMSPLVCMCSTMNRIDPQHLAWCLDNLVEGRIVNQITVPDDDKVNALISLEKMLAVS